MADCPLPFHKTRKGEVRFTAQVPSDVRQPRTRQGKPVGAHVPHESETQVARTPKRLPTQIEALDGLKRTAANARQMLKSADAAAGIGNYGPAVALTVLGLEESIRARTLGALAVVELVHVAIPEDTLRKVIYQGHQEWHEVGLVQHLFSDLHTPNFDATQVQKAQTLLQDANRFKQAGFYSDFDPDTGTWTTPDQVTKVECEEYRELAETFQVETERQVALFPQ
jgi:AbiV family abortive infection protein